MSVSILIPMVAASTVAPRGISSCIPTSHPPSCGLIITVAKRLHAPLSGGGPPSLGVLDFGYLLVGDRRESGPLVEVGDDAGQHPEHMGAVERDVFRLGIGLGPRIDHDHFPAVQTVQPLAAPAEGIQLARKAGLKIGVDLGGGRLLT